jgi:hypothetical protein
MNVQLGDGTIDGKDVLTQVAYLGPNSERLRRESLICLNVETNRGEATTTPTLD